MSARTERPAAIQITVASADGPYAVLIGDGLLADAAERLTGCGLAVPATVVTSTPIWRLYRDALAAIAGPQGPVLIPDGERAKHLRTVTALYESFAARRLDRSSVIVAAGGGIVGDVAGFAAATYLRGLPLVQIPTTLLAQVDSAIGGKVGVNLATGKNLVGAFHAPSLVLVDPQVLRSLPRREFRAGLYEVIKYGVIASRRLFEDVSRDITRLLRREAAILTPVIAACCDIKARIAGADEYETGPRRALNFGHTVGHALEAITRYRRFRHGEAVAYGMLAAAALSARRGVMPAADRDALADVIHRLGPLPAVADLRAADALEAIARDKKTVAGRLHFVLSAGLGRTEIVRDVTDAELRAAIQAIGLGA